MEYWKDMMNWPIDRDWTCETCEHKHPSKPILVLFPALTWGLVHGVCRCDICHTQYTMRIGGERVERPECLLKENYKTAAKAGWQEFGAPISEWTDDMFDKAFELAKVEPDWSPIMISI